MRINMRGTGNGFWTLCWRGNGSVQQRGPLETVGGGVTRKRRFICSGEGSPFLQSWLDLGPKASVKETDKGYPCSWM